MGCLRKQYTYVESHMKDQAIMGIGIGTGEEGVILVRTPDLDMDAIGVAHCI